MRQRVMTKLLANLATNPLSALTGDTLAGIGRNETLLSASLALAEEFRGWAANLDRVLNAFRRALEAIAFAVAWKFPDKYGHREEVIGTTTMVVLFTVFAMGGTTTPVLRASVDWAQGRMMAMGRRACVPA